MTDATTARSLTSMTLAELLECIALNSDIATHIEHVSRPKATTDAEDALIKAEADWSYERRNAAMREVLARHRRGDL